MSQNVVFYRTISYSVWISFSYIIFGYNKQNGMLSLWNEQRNYIFFEEKRHEWKRNRTPFAFSGNRRHLSGLPLSKLRNQTMPDRRRLSFICQQASISADCKILSYYQLQCGAWHTHCCQGVLVTWKYKPSAGDCSASYPYSPHFQWISGYINGPFEEIVWKQCFYPLLLCFLRAT